MVFWSGHGVQAADSHETCGVDKDGKLIPFERWAKRFAQIENVFILMIL